VDEKSLRWRICPDQAKWQFVLINAAIQEAPDDDDEESEAHKVDLEPKQSGVMIPCVKRRSDLTSLPMSAKIRRNEGNFASEIETPVLSSSARYQNQARSSPNTIFDASEK
jgi:hypothetical protein